MSKRILLTGASGFVGSHCLEALQAADYEVHAVYSRHEPPRIANVVVHSVDLTGQGEVTSLLNMVQPSHLLHFAWYAVPGRYSSSLENVNWCRVTLEMVQRFAEVGGKRAVLAGSCFEY